MCSKTADPAGSLWSGAGSRWLLLGEGHTGTLAMSGFKLIYSAQGRSYPRRSARKEET